jgi:tetratricopeptide (TPR) repeat protein
MPEKTIHIDVSYKKANILFEQGRIVDAKNILEEALQENPLHLQSRSLLVRCFLNGKFSFQQQEQACIRFIQDFPQISGGYYYLAHAYRQANKYFQAQQSIKKALEIDPYDEDYFLELSYILGEKGDIKKAIEYAERSLEQNPNNIDAKHFLLELQKIKIENSRFSFMGKKKKKFFLESAKENFNEEYSPENIISYCSELIRNNQREEMEKIMIQALQQFPLHDSLHHFWKTYQSLRNPILLPLYWILKRFYLVNFFSAHSSVMLALAALWVGTHLIKYFFIDPFIGAIAISFILYAFLFAPIFIWWNTRK